MDALLIHPRALKHGLKEEQITHAWENAVTMIRRDRDDGLTDYVAIGFDQNGRAVEITARRKIDAFLIYHANTPPTARTLRELGLTRGNHGR